MDIDKVSINQLAKWLGLPEEDEVLEGMFDNGGYAYHDAYEYAINELEYSEEEAEEYALAREQEENDEFFSNWAHAVEQTADEVLGEAGLITHEITDGDYSGRFKIVPERNKDWLNAVRNTVDIINGYGMFEFDTIDDFLYCGSYISEYGDHPTEDDLKRAIQEHMHWITMRSEVYGTPSPNQIYERIMK